MFRRIAVTLSAALATILLTGCGEAPSNVAPATPLPTATPVGLDTPPPGSIYLGAYVPPAQGGVHSLETQVGRTLALDAHYYGWIGLFPGLQEAADVSNARIPVDSWNCGVSDAQIVSGSQDMLIVTRAQALKGLGKPVFLRFNWDPNLPAASLNRSGCLDSATDGNTSFSSTEYVAAYRHIHDIFVQQGVNNVIWVWSYATVGANPAPYYPGNAYVDWVAADLYNGAGATFSSVFAPQYTFLSQFNKPMLLTETAALPAAQSAYFASMVPALQQQFPKLDGLMYYDFSNFGENWSFSFPGLAAFTTLAADPYFNAYGSF